jgi:hypothetical protein
MNKKVYKANGLPLVNRRITYAASIAILGMVLLIFTSHWITKIINLLLSVISIFYLRYLKRNIRDIEITVEEQGLKYHGFILDRLKIRNADIYLQWDKINSVQLFDKEKGPLRIETLNGVLLFWNSSNLRENESLLIEISKRIELNRR